MLSRESTALTLLSAGVTAAQIALMQLLAYMQWYHFACLIVAVALLGFGASGTAMSLWRERLLASAPSLTPWMMFGAGGGLVAAVVLLQLEALRFDLHLLLVAPGHWLRLVTACLLLAVPFFCAGLATSLILIRHAAEAGRFYAANLAGGGVGALIGLGLIEVVTPVRAPGCAALLALFGAILLFTARRQVVGVVSSCGVALAALGVVGWAPTPAMSPFKDLARTLDLPGARIVHDRVSAQGWLQIVDAPSLRGAPPANLGFTGRVPHQLAVFIDGNRAGSILDDSAPDVLDIFGAGAEALPWRLGSPRRVLFLNEGTGGEAAFARQQGAREIVLVQPHRGLAAFLRARWTPQPDSVVIVVDEPRRVLARSAGRYDLVRLPTAGVFGGSSGLRAVGEDPLLTREAIVDAWRALGDDGLCMITAWMDHPERTPLRVLATLVAGLRDAGVATPAAHLVVVRGWSSITAVVTHRALVDTDIGRVLRFCAEQGFDPLVLPGLMEEQRAAHHTWDNPAFFTAVDAVMRGEDPATTIGAGAFRLDAPTDDRPYFSQFLRPTAIGPLLRSHGMRGMPFFELGSIVVATALAILTVLAAVLIVLPLAGPGRRSTAGGWTFAYFAALGAGFMLVEMVLMQRLTSFAGGAIPAAAIVIGTLLVSAGLGSRWSQRVAPSRRHLARITAGAGVAVLMLGVATAQLPVGWAVGWPVRAAICVLLIAPVGCVLGMAFPTGLRLLESRAPEQMPWAWAVNSCLSVITPSLATLLAVTSGFTVVFAVAALAYAGAATASIIRRDTGYPG